MQSSNDPCDSSSDSPDRDPGVSDSVVGDWRDPGVSESVAGDWQGIAEVMSMVYITWGGGEFSNFVGQMGGGGSARLLFLSIDTKHACQQLSMLP